MKSPMNHNKKIGSVTVEFAVVLPIVMLLLVGIIDFGRVVSVLHVMNNAVREGARVAAMPGGTNTLVLNKINTTLTGSGLAYDNLVFTPTDVSTALRDELVTIEIQIDFSSITLSGSFLPGFSGAQLTSSVSMRKEGFGS